MDPVESMLLEVAKTTIALFVVVDPVGTVPIIVSLTNSMDENVKRRNLQHATYTGSALLILFALVGQQLLAVFGISLYSFMIAGGILLLLLSIDILLRGETTQKIGSVEDVGVVPITFPLLVGPGAITTTIVIMQSSGYVVTIVAILIVMSLTWIILSCVDHVYSILGKTGASVVSKLMAVFVAAIAVQYILDGVRYYYPMK
jgi:multiple antibiotic resistance protein